VNSEFCADTVLEWLQKPLDSNRAFTLLINHVKSLIEGQFEN
jgi:hypothetical protein